VFPERMLHTRATGLCRLGLQRKLGPKIGINAKINKVQRVTSSTAEGPSAPDGPATPAAFRECPACRHPSVRVYVDAPERKFDLPAVGSSRTEFSHGLVLRCNSCRHGFRQNQPSYAELADIYRRMDVTVYEAEGDSRIRTAEKHLRMLRKRARVGNLLDVGCASGIFLESARRAGWQIRGIEPNAELAARAARRLGESVVVNTTLEDAPFPDDTFDAVTLWDVLEHVADPAGFLLRCRGLLRPSGTLLVKVPDLDSFTARAMRGKWPLLLPEHLNYFTRPSMRSLSARAGLQILGFVRSPVTFSLQYVLYRMGQHGIPGAAWGSRLIRNTPFGATRLPLYLGELYVFLRREAAEATNGGTRERKT
jgi:SAM-dependent methyltransferase